MAATKLREIQKLNQSIRSLLQKQIEDRECGFDSFVAKFTYEQGAEATPERQGNLANVYKAFLHCVSLLGEHGSAGGRLEDLVSALLKFRFQQHSELVATSFTQLLCCMVSANNTFLRPVLDMLAENFLPIPSAKIYVSPAQSAAAVAAAVVPVTTSDNSKDNASAPVPEPEANYTLVHDALKQLLSQTPIAIGHLMTALQAHFPHKSRNAVQHHDYVANLIAVADYAKAVADNITVLIVQKLIVIDVEIRLDYEPDRPNLTDAADADAATSASTPPIPPTPATAAEQPKTVLDINQKSDHALADKLDAMMLLMFKYIRRACARAKDAKVLASTFMHIFRRKVLLTHKCKYTQFLIFYITHFDKSFADLFVAQMLDCLTDAKAAAVTKQTCVAYCASYISRANFLTESTILSVLNFLLTWSFDYAQKHPNAFPSRQQNQMFYTVCQAALYICCFRAVKLAQTKRGADFLGKWKWRQLLSCPLDPMQFCLESVRREFPKAMMGALRLRLSCNALESGVKESDDCNNNENTSGGLGRGLNPLDSFFPFDPYLLFQSSSFVHKLYVPWTPIEPPPGMEDDEIFSQPMDELDDSESSTDSEEDDSMDEDDDADMDTDTGSVGGMDLLDSPSMTGMGGGLYPQRARCNSFEVMEQPRRLRCNSFEVLSRGAAEHDEDGSLEDDSLGPSLIAARDEVEHMVVEAIE